MADREDNDQVEMDRRGHADPATSPPPGPKQPRLSLWMLLGIVVVIVIAAVVLTATLFGGGSEVPDLAGLSVAEATNALEHAGLTLGKTVYTEELPTGSKEGDIVGQMPPPGKQVEKGTSVDIIVARGAQ